MLLDWNLFREEGIYLVLEQYNITRHRSKTKTFDSKLSVWWINAWSCKHMRTRPVKITKTKKQSQIYKAMKNPLPPRGSDMILLFTSEMNNAWYVYVLIGIKWKPFMGLCIFMYICNLFVYKCNLFVYKK